MALHIQAHRGASAELMENTLPAFQRAFEIGVDSVELDIHRTKDGRLVVFHDEAFNPAYSHGFTGKISDLTLAEIQAVDFLDPRRLKAPNSLSREERKIPALEEVLALAANFRAIVDIEIKLTADPKGLAQLLLDTIRKHSRIDKVVVRSFELGPLSEMRKSNKEIQLAYLTESGVDRFHEVVGEIQPKIWAPRFDSLTGAMVGKIHQKGVQAIPWTVNDPKDWARLITMGVDGMTTDDPARLKKFDMR